MNEQNDVIIFDTTLRDGEQTPGVALSTAEKIDIAHALEALGVDVVEAGFPISGPGDFQAVRAVGGALSHTTVSAFARAKENDIETAADALKKAARPRIHTFLATSPIHMRAKLRMAPERVLETIDREVRRARNFCDDVEFSAEDASRSDPDFLRRAVETAIRAGATTINLPDTVGYALPHLFGPFIRGIIEGVPDADRALFSTHCHNDLGLAVANSLAAVSAGVRQMECTINGLGERAGNAALEEIVMALKTHPGAFPAATRVDARGLVPLSQKVAALTGVPVQPNKAIVGGNAFAHESGIHQDGLLKERATYEIMDPAAVGWQRSRLVLGKHSGRNAFKDRMRALGVNFPSEPAAEAAFRRFKATAERTGPMKDAELRALAVQN